MKLKELFTDESKWIKQKTAINMRGQGCLANDVNACQWCLLGGIYKCYGFTMESGRVYNKIRNYLGRSPVGWQDQAEITFADVRVLIDTLDI